MLFNKEQLGRIYDRTSGYCHICHKKLSRANYGVNGAKGAWHVEHSKPRCDGGTDHMNNLFPACIGCNCQKGRSATPVARRRNGKTRAPLNPEQRQHAKFENGVAGIVVGGLAGAAFGPLGALVGAVAGACVGSSGNPDRV